ncbi:uncharacterized protein LOC111832158 [Capsella rubella]|uniref:uncharacterized protein LOC111832158 n=1 Tax=Capsella rubella TaxID=81985 RepID=UPI000CD51929|nr:uncharacterized protein LOC111832158 [Capsella rubella]
MGTCAADSTIVEIWREQPPSSYSLKINKPSKLNSDKYKTRRFLSGGYNWRLVIYPKGNEKDKGNGFVSLYVELDDTSLMSKPPSEVFAYLVFFVYNKKANKYFTIQDVEVKRKWISFNFHLAENEKLKSDERIYTRGVLRVLDPYGSNHATKKFVCWHDESNSSTGQGLLVSMAKLREAYLDKEDTLRVEIEFEVVSSTSYSSII